MKDGGTAVFREVSALQFNWNTSTPTGLPFQDWSLVGLISPAALFEDAGSVLGLQIQGRS